MPTKYPLAQERKTTNTKHAVGLRRRDAKITEIPYNLPAWISLSKCYESKQQDL